MSSSLFPRTSYVRVRHLKTTKGPIYLADLDTQDNKGPLFKRHVYVPFGGEIEIPLVDDVLFSYRSGTIRRFQDAGLIEAAILTDSSVSAVDGGDSKASAGSDIILVSTATGPSSITLPAVSEVSEGSSILIIKTSPDANSLSIKASEGDSINGGSGSLTSQKAYVAFVLSTGEGGWWLVSEHPNEGGGGGSPAPDFSFHEVEHEVTADTEGLTVSLGGSPVSGSVGVFVNGLRLSSRSWAVSGEDVVLDTGVSLYEGDEVTVTFCLPT